MPDKKPLEDGAGDLDLQSEGTVHGDRREAAGHVVSVVGREMNAGDPSPFPPFYSVQDPAHGMVPPTLSVGLPVSVKTPWKRPHRRTQRCIF